MRNWKTLALVPALMLAACAVEPPRPQPSYPPSSPAPRPPARPPAKPPARPAPTPVPGTTTPAPPPAPANERDRPPLPSEIPPNVGDTPDAVPEALEKSRYGNPESYEVFGIRYDVLQDPTGFKERGHASWYGKKFHGRRTSSGDNYDMFAMTAAHKTLPIPTFARVTNLSNGKSVIVKVNDRGPFHPGRIVDLSYAAAHRIGILGDGSGEVELEVVDASGKPAPAPATPVSPPVLVADNHPRTSLPAAVAVPVSRKTPARFLQAGTFSDSRNAATFREHLAIAGVKPLLMKSESRNGRWIYRVLIGPIDEPSKLTALRRKLALDETMTVPVSE